MKINLNIDAEAHEIASVMATLAAPFREHIDLLKTLREEERPAKQIQQVPDRLDELVALMAARPLLSPSQSVAVRPSPPEARTIQQVAPQPDSYPWTPGISRDFLISADTYAKNPSVSVAASAVRPAEFQASSESQSESSSAVRPSQSVPTWVGAAIGVTGISVVIGYGIFRLLPTQAPDSAQPVPIVKPSPIKQSSSLIKPAPTKKKQATSRASGPKAKDVSSGIFQGGENSLVAKAIGNAEGTRTANGDKNPAYGGHRDPGNGVWNLGSFSYQHCSSCTPAQADELQIRRLKGQGQQLLAQARSLKRELTLDEYLNGLDLANQAPLAALDRGGFLDRLVQAPKNSDQVIHARTYSFFSPDTGRLNAPGLGNNLDRVWADQTRRTRAVRAAIDVYFSEKNN